MICRYDHLRRHPSAFLTLTGLRLDEFEELLTDMLPPLVAAEQIRLQRTNRRRAIGAGRQAQLCRTNQLLLVIIWLRQYPANEVLGYLFGVSDSTASRLIARILPLLEAAGKDTMRLPDPGRKHRRDLDALPVSTPDLAVIIDTFEQRVQRSKDRTDADGHYSGKKKQHTLKSQVALNELTGEIVYVADSVPGPSADITVVKETKLLERLPDGVGDWRFGVCGYR